MNKSLLKDFLTQTGIAIAFLIGVPGLLETFGVISDARFKSSGWLGVLFLLLISYAWGVTYALIREVRRNKLVPKPSELVSIIKQIENDGWHKEVVAIGTNLSRHLWVTGKWYERIEIGKSVFKAAGAIDLPEEQLKASVDMVGWTSEAVGNSAQAEFYLNQAISLAEKNNSFYYLAKAYRHLGGVSYRKKDYDKAEDSLNKAEKTAHDIQDEKKRKEMFAGILYGKSEIQLGRGHYESAIIPHAARFCA